ncbi:hypothetical protein QCA50_011326 [Cerrena zonata]|uniref:Uncharacterized protein n=1 Tax=Cerrena zonata TaxID=2478898 RepID=A0AAW0FZC9_9APHY
MPAYPSHHQQPSSPTPSNGTTLVGSPNSFASSATLVNSPVVGYATPPNSYKPLAFAGQPSFQLHALLAVPTQLRYDVRYGPEYLQGGAYGIDAVAIDWKSGQVPKQFTIVHGVFCIDIPITSRALTVRDILEGVRKGLSLALTSQEMAMLRTHVPEGTQRISMLGGRFMFVGLHPTGPSSAALILS